MLSNTQIIHQGSDSVNHSWETNHSQLPSQVTSPTDSGLDVSAGGTSGLSFYQNQNIVDKATVQWLSSVVCIYPFFMSVGSGVNLIYHASKHIETVWPFTNKAASFASGF